MERTLSDSVNYRASYGPRGLRKIMVAKTERVLPRVRP